MQAQEEKKREAVKQEQLLVESPPGAYAALLVSLGLGIGTIVVISLIVLFGVYP